MQNQFVKSGFFLFGYEHTKLHYQKLLLLNAKFRTASLVFLLRDYHSLFNLAQNIHTPADSILLLLTLNTLTLSTHDDLCVRACVCACV